MKTWARALGTLVLALTAASFGCGSDGGSNGDDDEVELTSMGGANTYQGSGGGDSTSSGGRSTTGSGGSSSDGCPANFQDIGFGPQNDCPEVGLECDYGFVTCECTNNGWDCPFDTGQAGAAATDNCPNSEPSDGDPCQTFNLACSYSGTDCTCTFGQGGPGGGGLSWDCGGGNQFGTGGAQGSGGADQGSGGTESTSCADGNGCSTPGSSCTDSDGNGCYCNTNNEWQC